MDQILHIELAGGEARALIADTTEIVRTAREIHKTSSTATAALGRTLTICAMMGVMLKEEGESLTATIKGDGPLGTIVCTAYQNGEVKGYVDHPRATLPPKANGKLDVGGIVGKGSLTVVKDLGMKEPYVSQTELVSGEIAEDFTWYLVSSEHTPSLLSLGVMVQGKDVLQSAGLLIQPLPGCSNQTLSALEGLANLVAEISTLAHDAGSMEKLCQLVFVGLDWKVLSVSEPAFICRCSREKLENILVSLGTEELEDMIQSQHGATLQCHFCNQKYEFSEADLQQLLMDASSQGKEVSL